MKHTKNKNPYEINKMYIMWIEGVGLGGIERR
jgi:hypothetical protein